MIETSFYQTGGSLHHDAPSYVERRADTDLYVGLLAGEFCYVLTSRQMGKSSLMVRTARRLRNAGLTVVSLDLTALGTNLSPEQWYGGLLDHLARQLDLEDELEAFWLAHERLGPLQRWMAALETIVLPRVGGGYSVSGVREGPGRDPTPYAEHPPPSLVLFLDEIDVVRSLPFSTDEFFAAIRECYNRRTRDPAFQQLTFCLLGVASPSELIQDTRMTPFNIGRRIELTDFTQAEVEPLAAGLGVGCSVLGVGPIVPQHSTPHTQRLLERVLYWTNGHPYLTQRLCLAVAEELRPDTKSEEPESIVDHLCHDLFLTPRARERDDNLIFVRERLLRSEPDRTGVLDLYGKVWRGQRVRDDETNPLAEFLRLSGIVARWDDGCLRVRSRIYARVFDREWITQNMPDAELRRQQAAYRRGLARAAAVFGVILALGGGLALTGAQQARLRRERRISEHAAQQEQRLRREYVYAAQINAAQGALEAGNPKRARDLLAAQQPERGQPDLRGWEWGYLWRLSRRDDSLRTLQTYQQLYQISLSRDGRILATCGNNPNVKLWDVASGREVACLPSFVGGSSSVAFSPDGRLLAGLGAVSSSRESSTAVRLWVPRQSAAVRSSFESWRPVATWKVADGVGDVHGLSGVGSVAFSPDGRRLAGGSGSMLRLWDLRTRRSLAVLRLSPASINEIAFSPDGRTLAVADDSNRVKLWDVRAHRVTAELMGHQGKVKSVAYSPDGRLLAAGSAENGQTLLWDVGTRQVLATLVGRGTKVAVAFSPDGKTLATAGWDCIVQLWDMRTKAERASLWGHQSIANTVAFGGQHTLVTGDADGNVKFQSANPIDPNLQLRFEKGVEWGAFSSDGRWFVDSRPSHAIDVWDLTNRRKTAKLPASPASCNYLELSPDARTIAIGSIDQRLTLRNVSTGRVILPLQFALRSPFPRNGAFSPDSRRFATGIDTHSVGLWDLSKHRQIRTFSGHTGPDAPLSLFSPNGRQLLTWSHDWTARLWDVGTGRLIKLFNDQRNWVGPVAFSPDGKTLAICSGGELSISIWNLLTMRKVATLNGYPDQLVSMAFSPDGRTLVTTSRDNTLRIWNAATWQQVAMLTQPRLWPDPLAFTSDGRALLTGGDGMLRRWPAITLADARPLLALYETYRRVGEAEKEGRWADIVPLVDQWILSDPAKEGAWVRRASAEAELGRWAAAAADLRTACLTYRSDDVDEWQRWIVSEWATGQVSGCRRAVAELLRRFEPLDGAEGSTMAASLLSILPEATTDRSLVIRLAKNAIAAEPSGADAQAALGAALYRSGQFPAAIRRLNAAVELARDGASPESCLFLAMAHQSLGQSAAAKPWRDRATRWIDEAKQAGNVPGTAFRFRWDRRLLLQRLQKEADAQIAKVVLQ